jgi:hypothetical protein
MLGISEWHISAFGRNCCVHWSRCPAAVSDWSMARMQSCIMALANAQGLPVKLLLLEGQAYEGDHVIPLLEAPAGLRIIGDSQPQAARRARRSRGNGFNSDKLRLELEELGFRFSTWAG